MITQRHDLIGYLDRWIRQGCPGQRTTFVAMDGTDQVLVIDYIAGHSRPLRIRLMGMKRARNYGAELKSGWWHGGPHPDPKLRYVRLGKTTVLDESNSEQFPYEWAGLCKRLAPRSKS